MSYVKVIGNLKTIASNWFIQITDIVTSIRDSASDSKVPSEKAVRTAISEAVTGAISGDLYTADEQTITLSDDREFSVKNGGIGADQLSTDVNTSLALANSALQEHQSLASYYTSSQTDAAIAAHHDNTKQDVITDLATIRSGAAAGATALQSSDVVGNYAPLEDNKIPEAYLPSYVDEVREGYYSAHDGHWYIDPGLETYTPGEADKIYVDLATNKTYRWSGTAFVEIAKSLALGTTENTAYSGAAGAQNAADIAANTTAIAANTTAIAENAADIADNAANITALQSSKISTNALSSYINIQIATPTTEETAAGLSAGDLYFVFNNEEQPSA